jgi:hypothetical protein
VADVKNEVVVRSGAIGPIALGMKREDVERLGLSVRPHPSGQMGDNVRMVGPYYVVFTAGRVHSVEITPRENGASLRIGQRVFPPSVTGDEIAAALPACGAWENLDGGRMRRCDGGKMLLKLGASCAARAPNGACDRWDPAHPDLAVQAIQD